MIHVTATVTICAEDDAQADEVWAALHAVNRTWPETPIVNITETDRHRPTEGPGTCPTCGGSDDPNDGQLTGTWYHPAVGKALHCPNPTHSQSEPT